MKLLLLDFNVPVTLEIEEHDYKSKITMTRGDVAISADLTDMDFEEIRRHFVGSDLAELDEENTKLEEEIDRLKSKKEELEDEVDELEDELASYDTREEESRREIEDLKLSLKEALDELEACKEQ